MKQSIFENVLVENKLADRNADGSVYIRLGITLKDLENVWNTAVERVCHDLPENLTDELSEKLSIGDVRELNTCISSTKVEGE